MEYELGKPCPYCGEGSTVKDGGAVGYFCSNGLKCKAPSPFDDRSYGAMGRFEAPPHLRKGQALFIFLVWLSTHKKVAHLRIADEHPWEIANTFYVDDDALERWWNEWVASLDADRK